MFIVLPKYLSICNYLGTSTGYHTDSYQEFAKVGGDFSILHVVVLLVSSN